MAAESPLIFPSQEAARLEPHLPPLSGGPTRSTGNQPRPFVTLTFATSLDSALSLGPGIRTSLSGPQSKAMTHYLRSRHDAICIGVGTAIADDPGLNCRLAAAAGDAPASSLGSLATAQDSITDRQPRPIVIDPALRWHFTAESKVMRLARAGKGLAPYIITAVSDPPLARKQLLEGLGGKYVLVKQLQKVESGAPDTPSSHTAGRLHMNWHTILAAVRQEGLQSIMIEGGGAVINSLLSDGEGDEDGENYDAAGLVDSVIITIAPTWLGPGSVFVCPPRKGPAAGSDQPTPAARLANTMWMPLGEDVVLCGKLAK
ncbi:putative riboflavin biosynthesis protein Rib7 [Xylariomycetidae sp. FL0641]|nr:putative riboflavin biosynthesis protein Rib7 [Xylariomycetidae sp. FL0641]